MRLWGVAMVRNEADIVEAFVRHALSHLDGLIVADHASTDATPRILAALCGERLPLVVKRTEHAGYLQAEITTSLAREAFALGRADAVFPLDADEFLRVPSRARLEDALRAIPPGHVGLVAWPTYVPQLGNDADIVARIGAARPMRPKQRSEQRRKVVLGPAFVAVPAAYLGMGNHDVMVRTDAGMAALMPGVALDPGIVEVCHVPIRSVEQFVTKTAVMGLARIAAGREFLPGSARYAAFEALKRGAAITPAAMLAPHLGADDAEIAATFAAPYDRAHRFMGDLPLRYTPVAAADPMPLVLSVADHLARRLAAARRRDDASGEPPGQP